MALGYWISLTQCRVWLDSLAFPHFPSRSAVCIILFSPAGVHLGLTLTRDRIILSPVLIPREVKPFLPRPQVLSIPWYPNLSIVVSLNFAHRILVFFVCLFVCLFVCFVCTCNMWKFPGQGLNLSHSSDNAESLIPYPSGNSGILVFLIQEFKCTGKYREYYSIYFRPFFECKKLSWVPVKPKSILCTLPLPLLNQSPWSQAHCRESLASPPRRRSASHHPCLLFVSSSAFTASLPTPHRDLGQIDCVTSANFIFLFCEMRIIAAPTFSRLFWDSNVVMYVVVKLRASVICVENPQLRFQGCRRGRLGRGGCQGAWTSESPGAFSDLTYLPYTCMRVHK